ncbi:beta-N-acetylhexosaminidase activity protein [Halocaridina rubra]|uniref:beta-N-acetylhexosaminidase n=1 Tax=Halocaridina rubra TaxID=373956 RepID=A0AAN8X4E5_HALRR
MRVLVFTALVVAAAATNNFFQLPTPYSYECSNNQCRRVERSLSRQQRSLGECQLTCGRYGSLWPKPTGDVRISPDVVRFNPYNMRVTKIAASNQRLTNMLRDATGYFTRNIHQYHPDFPESQKTPYTEDQKEIFTAREMFNQEFDQLRSFQEREQQQSFRRLPQSHPNRQQTNTEFSPFTDTYENWERYSPFMNQKYNAGIERNVVNLEITVTSPEVRQNIDTDESYNLVIQTLDDKTTVTILAPTYAGARHALETLSQLITYDEDKNSLMVVKNARITDKPAYKYRGLMLDTGRNYYTKEELMSLLDAMSQNKMNIFHWHLTDASAFPLYSTRVPQMAYYGAYSPRKMYYPEDIQNIVEYARHRGIIVIPEIDGPAHTGAGWEWGEKEGKGKMVLCTNKYLNDQPWYSVSKEPLNGQLNPVNPEVYNVLGELYRDLVEYFDPEMVHFGGDDVSFRCWNSADEIQQFFANNNREATSRENFELWNTYQSNAFSKLQEAAEGRKITPIIHSSSFARNYVDKETYVIQLTESANDSMIAEYVNNGFKVIFSNPDQWRLDCAGTSWLGEKAESCPNVTPTWRNFYDRANSPLDMLYNLGVSNARSEIPVESQQQSAAERIPREAVWGGTATLWSFETDGKSIQSKTWPKVSALAERLWSDPHSTSRTSYEAPQKRLNVQRQRMVSRGIDADPLQPEYCMHDETACYSQEEYQLRSTIPQ